MTRPPRIHPALHRNAALACITLTLTLHATPLCESTHVFQAGQDGYHAYRIPGVETAPDGTILAFAEARKNNLGDPGTENNDIDLVLKRSQDQGVSWSPMVIVEDPGEFWSAGNPATVVDRDTRIVWLFYLRCKPGRNTNTARPGTDDSQILARTSSDNGATWSAPIDLTAVSRDLQDPNWRCTVVGPGGGVQLRDGRLVLPAWRFEPWGVFALYSEDHGNRWLRSQLVPGVIGDECQLVELSDNRLLLDVRQQNGPRRERATSTDGGHTWSRSDQGEPVTPVCCAIERFTDTLHDRDGQRLLWTGPAGPERSNLVVRVSYDQGRTFPHQRPITTGPAAYSDLTILKDNTVGVLWEGGTDQGYQRITFTRFNLEWLESTAPPAN